jgi:hypothetical protein
MDTFYQEPKILLTNILPQKRVENREILNNLEKSIFKNHRYYEIYIGQELSKEYPESISLKKLHENNVRYQNKIMPLHHPYSQFHFQYVYPRYEHKLSYPDYCLLEESIVKIIKSSLKDTSDRKFVYIFTDKRWFYEESIMSYFSPEERQNIHRLQFLDLDEKIDYPLIPSEKKIYLWNINHHLANHL